MDERFYDALTLRKYLDLYPARCAWYKEMEILNVQTIGKNHCHLILEVPLPMGGDLFEVVAMSTNVYIEKEDSRGK